MHSSSAREYARAGCVRLESLLTPQELALLRAECDNLRRNTSDADLIAADCVVDIAPGAACADGDASRCDSAAYLAVRDGDPAVGPIVLEVLASAASAVISAKPNLFNEHYVCKPARVAGEFYWHTDAAHQCEALIALGQASEAVQYVSAWVALDDVEADNGALILLPADRPQPPDASCLLPASSATEAWLGDVGRHQHAVTTLGMRAGDALLFSSLLWHCSEPNRSPAVRRAYYAQYSSGTVGTPGAPLALAVPTKPDAARMERVHVGALPPAGAHGASKRKRTS